MLVSCISAIILVIFIVSIICFINSNYYKWMMGYKNINHAMKEKAKEYNYGYIKSSYKEIKDIIRKCNINRDSIYNYIYRIDLDNNITIGDKLNSLSFEFVHLYCICNSLKMVIYCKKDIAITLEAKDDYVSSILAYIILPPTDYYKLNKFLKFVFNNSTGYDLSKDSNISLDELIRSYRGDQIQRSINTFVEETGTNCIYHIDEDYNVFIDVDEEKENK